MLYVRPSRGGDRERGGLENRTSHAVALALVVHEVKQFVFLDGPAKAAAKLFQVNGRLRQWRYIEEVARIEDGVPGKQEGRPVNGVGPRFQSRADNGARLPAEFRLRGLLGI